MNFIGPIDYIADNTNYVKAGFSGCQAKIEMSSSYQSRNVRVGIFSHELLCRCFVLANIVSFSAVL
jgi:hypothetical protein